MNDTHIRKLNYAKGKTIFGQGEAGDAAYIVESGKVGIFRQTEHGEIQLAALRQGEIFGEMAVLDGSRRMATARALDDSVLSQVPQAAFNGKVAKTDPFIRALLMIFARNLREVHNAYSRKPRSFADLVKGLSAHTANLRNYINVIEVDEFSAEVAAQLAELDRVVTGLTQLAERHHDRRHDNLDERGV